VAKAVADDREAVSRARKARRYAGRRTLWKITGDAACKGCGRNLMDPAAGVIMAQTAQGVSVVLGLMRCARIWFCPVCSAVIRHKRAEEITRAVVEWIKRGGSAYLVTFTVRHDYQDDLGDLMDALQGTRKDEAAGIKRRPGAYQRLITGGTWAGDPRKVGEAAQLGIRGRIGYVGMIRATEVTVGLASKWHPHIHVIVFVGGALASLPETKKAVTRKIRGKAIETVTADKVIGGTFQPDAKDLKAWEKHWRTVWTGHLAKVNPKYRPSETCAREGCKCKGKGHGVDFKRLKTVQDAQELGEYIAKTQDGKDPANELARGDLKTGRDGNMTPFELLYRIGDLTGGVLPDEDEEDDGPPLGWCIDRWHEYERGVTGRRAIEWTRGLRTLLGITGGDTDDDDKDLLLGADADAGEFRGGAAVTEEGWEATWRRGLDLAATEAAEGKDANADPEAVARRVREVLDMAKAPAGSVRALTSGEVADAYAAMLASFAQRREEAAARRRREAERDAARRLEKPSA
jgi:hypothetical protein